MHFPETMLVAQADRRACRDLLRTGSKTFFAASHLLPRRVREPAIALYAFCRLADDAVDLHDGRLATLARLRDRLDRAYRGQPLPLAADRAFADTVAHHAIPRALPEALLEGLEWDAREKRYETLSDLHAYAARVAGSVGAMMAVIMGVGNHDAIARACDLGAAMQLTNIARDVGEDARNGRIYLPLSWLREVGIDPGVWLAAPHFSPAIGRLVQRLLSEADALYRASEAGIAQLPLTCRPGIRAARLLYAEIGAAIGRLGYDSATQRAFVPKRRKAELMLKALVSPSHVGDRPPALAEARFLIDAIETTSLRATTPRANMGEQVVWVMELFDRIERRRQVQGL